MKKFIAPVATGGLPVFASDLNLLQSEIFDAYEGLLKDVGRGVIIDGCKVSGNTASPGIVYLNGKFIRFNGFTGTPPIFLSESDSTISPRTFKDTSVKDAIVEPTLQVSTTQPATGQFIRIASDDRYDFLAMMRERANRVVQLGNGTDVHSLRKEGTFAIFGAANGPTNNWCYYEVMPFDTNPNNLYIKVIAYNFFDSRVWMKTVANGGWSNWTELTTTDSTASLQAQINNEVAVRAQADTNEANARANGDTHLQNQINNLNATDASLQGQINNRTSMASGWQSPGAINGYGFNSNFQSFGWRKNGDNGIEMRGHVFTVTNGPAAAFSLPACLNIGDNQLTGGIYRYFPVLCMPVSSGTSGFSSQAAVMAMACLQTDGRIFVYHPMSSQNYVLFFDGITIHNA